MKFPWSLLQMEQAHHLRPPFTGEALQPSNHPHSLPWICSNSSMYLLFWGSQSWMQYCKWDLKRTEQRETIFSFALLVSHLVIKPKMQLAFWAVSAHCWLVSSFSSTRTLKSFFSVLFSIQSSFSLCWNWKLPWLKCRTLLLAWWTLREGLLLKPIKDPHWWGLFPLKLSIK